MNAAVAWILQHLAENNRNLKDDEEEEEAPVSLSSSCDHSPTLSSSPPSLSSSLFFTSRRNKFSSDEISRELGNFDDHGKHEKTSEEAKASIGTGEQKERRRRKKDLKPFYTPTGESNNLSSFLSRVCLCFHDVDILPRRRQSSSAPLTSLQAHELCKSQRKKYERVKETNKETKNEKTEATREQGV